MSYILIVGAKSDIAKATAREYAKNGYDLYLAARNSGELEDFAADVKVRSSREIKILELDILNFDSHKSFYESLPEKPLGVLTAAGYLGEQEKAERDFAESRKIIDTNYTGLVSLLNIIAADFEKRKSGFIVAISSVAGDRGRRSNYLYGSSKAAFSAYLSGLRSRMQKSQVHIMTVKPGFVQTKMTENIDLPEKLTAKPEEVASDIFKAQQKHKNILYTKWYWYWIMLIVKHIPEFIFKKLNM